MPKRYYLAQTSNWLCLFEEGELQFQLWRVPPGATTHHQHFATQVIWTSPLWFVMASGWDTLSGNLQLETVEYWVTKAWHAFAHFLVILPQSLGQFTIAGWLMETCYFLSANMIRRSSRWSCDSFVSFSFLCAIYCFFSHGRRSSFLSGDSVFCHGPHSADC